MEGYGGIQKMQWVFDLQSAEMRNTDQGLACRCERPAMRAINRFVTEINHDPNPLTWTADPDKIIAAVRRVNP